MASKRGSRSSTRKGAGRSASKSAARKSGRGSAKKSARKRRGMSSRKSAGAARARGLATRVKRTARKVLFGSLGVAGYVTDVARSRVRNRRTPPAGDAAGVKPIPDGYHTVTPYLTVRDVPRLIEFVQQAFGATEILRMPGPDGAIAHAEVAIGDSRVMMGEANPASPAMPANLHLYVVDTDALYHLALQAGATSLREPQEMFYGDRMAGVRDPVGNHWWIATHKEDLSPAELARRSAARPSGT
jgi:PhnB protein